VKYITEDNEQVRSHCERCRLELKVPKDNLVSHNDSFDLKATVQCQCGRIHNLILGNSNTLKWANEKVKFDPNYVPSNQSNTVSCPLCKSVQLYAGDKGFSLGSAAAGGILFGPVGLLGGFLGSKTVMITCLNCGHKWEAGRI